nr:PREDICTED: thymocyte selection-associated high mobility group box protein TOX-like [Paralichthys olivaceus]
MDVTVYPPPPQPLAVSNHARLGQLSYPDPAFGNNKLDGDTMFLGMPEAGLDFASTNQFRVPQPPQPLCKVSPTNQPTQHWRRDTHMPDSHRLPWSYSVGGLGDEDFNIPPITPPTLPEHMMPPHIPHNSPSGPYHPLEPPPSSAPHHLYQLQGMDLPGMSGGQDGAAMLNQDGSTFSPDSGPMTSTLSVMQQMVNSDSRFTSSQQPIEAALGPRNQSGMSQQSQLSTINQSQLGLSGNSVTHSSPSPPESKSATPSPSSSAHEDENDDGLRYKKKTETAKKEYLKQLAAYRASLVSQSYNDPSEMKLPHSSSSSSSSTSMFTPKPSVYPGHPGQHPSSSSLSHPHPHPHPHPQHPGMYMQYPHPSHPSHASSPGLGPHLSPPHTQIHPQLQALSSRGTVPRTSVPHQGALSLGNVVTASTPPLRVTPPLHSQAHLGGLHSPHHQHQQLSGHSMGMTHSPAITQGYLPSLRSDYQQIGGGMLNGGAVMSSSVDYHQLGRHTPNHHPSLDWSTDYHGNGAVQRDKTLYLS